MGGGVIILLMITVMARKMAQYEGYITGYDVFRQRKGSMGDVMSSKQSVSFGGGKGFYSCTQ